MILPLLLSRPGARRVVAALLALATTTAASTALADEPGVLDALFDFAPTYVGQQNGDLDINFAAATLERGEGLLLRSNSVGQLGDRGPPTFVWGIDRGAGAERLVSGSPSVGRGVTFDAVLVLTGNGFTGQVSALLTTFGPDGPVRTELSSSAFAYDSVIGAVIPLTLLPSTGFDVRDYRVNLWTRDGSGNDHIADFAVDGGTFGIVDRQLGAVPEPAAWALMLGGFGMAGGVLRQRRRSLRLSA